ncbi:bile acid:sodium symporter family protein [Anaerosphaera multitolerans]|uniref:Bile acid:sodium symporter family protein n=1 Tax=Anaerosphaera multitolerans TaxID=2487351 RepID=A0A437SA80_9FIRM|nr:bile acid:sodium symporter family protein [Anaerosphaera multitolerans]RVU55714.1 bile acid:sodium symporter family protein [Anaerosphaera multitolerans]
MKSLEKISNTVGKYMSIIVLVVAALALFYPPALIWIKTTWVNTLLGIVMFGMGLTLTLSDFKVVFSRPKDVIFGVLAQFILMPLIAFILTKVFNLSPELTIGVILVGTCPGGTSSNVMTYLAKGDVALSVGMTTISTLLAPILTPFLTYLYAGQRVDVNMLSMFFSIIKVVILPIALGFIVNRFFGKTTEKVTKVLPLVSVTAIVMIVGSVVSANASKILTSGILIVTVVVLHNLLGYATGYLVGKTCGMSRAKSVTVAIEVGMQNSGLATSLAATHFATMPLATIPGAVFSVWHNISGSLFANIMANRAEE